MLGKQSCCMLLCSFFSGGGGVFPYHLLTCLGSKEAMLKVLPLRICTNKDAQCSHTSPEYYSTQTHHLQAGFTVYLSPALTVCPSSCSIFPDKYHPRQSIRDVNPFLRHCTILSLPGILLYSKRKLNTKLLVFIFVIWNQIIYI